MSNLDLRRGIRINIGTIMFAIAMFAVVFASLFEATNAGSAKSAATSIVYLFMMPVIVSLFLYRELDPDGIRKRTIATLWAGILGFYTSNLIIIKCCF